MKLRFCVCGLLINLTSSVFASQVYHIPISLYLLPEPYWASSILAQPQMTVSPAAQRDNIVSMDIQTFSSQDGLCTTQTGITTLISNSPTTFTLLSTTSYVSTDASNFAIFGLGGVYPATDNLSDVRFFFTADGTNPVGSISDCVQISAMTCTGNTECGFALPLAWTL
jgi:hypothetical protein